MHWRNRWRWIMALVWWAPVIAFVGFVFLWPLATYVIDSMDAQQAHFRIPLLEQVRIRVFEALTAAWVFMFGATVGSFLNVVAYRMPKGQSVIWRASYCPYCRQPIRPTDNIPVFGWLRLHGRCRTCHLPISARYPVVELAMGILFLVLAYVELFSGGRNLPGYAGANHYYGLTRTILDTRWDLAALYGYHGALIRALMAIALVQWDGQPVPRRLIFTVALAGLVAAAVWPDLQPVRWNSGFLQGRLALPASLARVDTSLMGVVCGGVLGAAIQAVLRAGGPLAGRAAVMAPCALVGLYLGWQAIVGVILIAAACRLAAVPLRVMWRSFPPLPAAAYILPATFLHICFWDVFHGIL